MRGLVLGLLRDNLPLETEVPDYVTYIPPDRWFPAARNIDQVPARPFAALRFGGTLRGVGPVIRRRIEVWVHDDEGGYDTIEYWLKYAKGLLDGAEHLKDAFGNELISSTWLNDGTDLWDDGYRTNCMNSVYDAVGKEG